MTTCLQPPCRKQNKKLVRYLIQILMGSSPHSTEQFNTFRRRDRHSVRNVLNLAQNINYIIKHFPLGRVDIELLHTSLLPGQAGFGGGSLSGEEGSELSRWQPLYRAVQAQDYVTVLEEGRGEPPLRVG